MSKKDVSTCNIDKIISQIELIKTIHSDNKTKTFFGVNQERKELWRRILILQQSLGALFRDQLKNDRIPADYLGILEVIDIWSGYCQFTYEGKKKLQLLSQKDERQKRIKRKILSYALDKKINLNYIIEEIKPVLDSLAVRLRGDFPDDSADKEPGKVHIENEYNKLTLWLDNNKEKKRTPINFCVIQGLLKLCDAGKGKHVENSDFDSHLGNTGNRQNFTQNLNYFLDKEFGISFSYFIDTKRKSKRFPGSLSLKSEKVVLHGFRDDKNKQVEDIEGLAKTTDEKDIEEIDRKLDQAR